MGPDDEVFEADGDALGRLLALDPPGKLGDLQRQRMHDQVVEDALGEDAPPHAVGVDSGPINPVRQFHDADGRERDVDLAQHGARLAEDFFDSLAAPFALDQDACVEDQAQGVSPMPTYCGACGCG